ncbi:hypothetical protein GBF38_001903 [Nibea albiflora]|uniref:Uncharacterized protein n=1 Tax=Nibea albiflora TaxID=240163 RepID=A0ACB7EDQ9_NIBAL|nr:hypothetical protein GBF38_001903 [Nibea albiflora]
MIGDSALKHGPSAATADAPAPATTHGNDTPWRPHTHLPSERASISNQQPSVRSKLPTQYPSSPTQQLQFHTPVRQPTDPGPDPQFTPGPPTLSPYTDPRIAPARISISQTPITPSATLPTFQPTGQTTMIPTPLPQTSVHRPPAVSLLPQDLPYPNFPESQSIQHPTMNQPAVSPYPTLVYQPSPQAPMLSSPAPHVVNAMNNPSTAEQTPQVTDYGQFPQLHMSQAAAHYSQTPLPSPANSAWGPNPAAPISLNVAQAAIDYAGGMTSGEVEPDAEESTEIEDTEDSGEQAGEVTMEGGESDPVEALEVNDMENNVEKCLPEITDGQIEHAGMEEVDVGTGQVSKAVEKHVTARGANLPPTPSVPRRSSRKNHHPPKKLSYELRAVESEEDRRRLERGWRLWQRAKARRAAGQ